MSIVIVDLPVPPPRRFLWREGDVYPFESAWSLLHKFSRWNRSRRKQLIRSFSDPVETGLKDRAAFHLQYHLLRSSWISRTKFQTKLRATEPCTERGSAFIAYYLETDDHRVLRANCALELRYCSHCLARMFHTPLFQILSIGFCPLHGGALRTRCTACNSPVPYQAPAGYKPEPWACKCGFEFHRPDSERLDHQAVRRSIRMRFAAFKASRSPVIACEREE